MDRSRPFQRPNPSSSSSSSNSSRFTPSKSSDLTPPTRKSRPNSEDNARHGRSGPRNSAQQGQHDPNDLSTLSTIVGDCPFMCPERERAQRERLRDLAVFERLNGNPALSSPSLAVKKFCRTITTKQMHRSDVRPLPVLVETLNYLLNLLDSSERSFEVIHDFVFDRTRSIRQDLSMQNIVNDEVILMYQEMVKFHVISHYKLRSCNSHDASSLHYLNMEQLTKTLTSLFNLYEANRSSNSACVNEAEFHSFYVLLHLGSNSQPMGESLSIWFRHVPSFIIHSKEMRFARDLLRSFRIGNYKRFLIAIAAEASYLQYCIIEPCVNEVRALALSFINNGAYKLHPYPLAHLAKLLMMEVSDVESFCKVCGLEICTDEQGNKALPTKQTTFSCLKGGFQRYSFKGLGRFEKEL